MLKKGDLVKVTGLAATSTLERRELIPIGTICEVIDVDEDGFCELVQFKSGDSYGYWYNEKDVEKGRVEWIPEEDDVIAQITWKMSDVTNAMEQMEMEITQEKVTEILKLLGYKTEKCVLEEYSDMIYDAILNAILDAKMKSEVN